MQSLLAVLLFVMLGTKQPFAENLQLAVPMSL
jgi:hypothetical protein